MKRIWTKEEIQALLKSNNLFLARAICKLYACQTTTEKLGKHTEDANGMGFNATDAAILSSFAEFFTLRGFLSAKQMEIARKKMHKYGAQLAGIANNQ